ncbi:glycosyltransferase family 4 protein [Reichenbachiella versicolor]|uniref:glycosyltransferase family 4 protein n=1 Tax=Reichenbachiella versicolor TaxID=1821036 RepID=UPI000D6E2FF0|nr:glycosyltransferase family 4 protein [Reichenbachiella versicolor]
MRIAIAINTSWNIYNFRSGLIRFFIKEGYEVIAIAPKDQFSKKLVSELGCDFVPISMENTGSNPLKDLLLLKQLKSIYKKYNPDVALHYTIKPNIFGTLAASSLDIPVINNVSGLGTVFLNNNFSTKIAKWLYKVSFKKANLVFFQNPDDQRDFLTEVPLDDLKTDLLPGSGVTLDLYNPSPLPNLNTIKFLMIARVIIDKGVKEYIEAAEVIKSKYSNVEFQLLGELDEGHARGIEAAYINQKHQEGVINYLGTSTDVRVEINGVHCVVLPSYREGTPKTLLEAASLARPLITTNVPGCKEVVIDQENGYLCNARDSRSLKDMIDKVINSSYDELTEMGKLGRKLVENKFDERHVIKKYSYHVSKLIKTNLV